MIQLVAGQPTYKHFARYIQIESEMTLFIFCHLISNFLAFFITLLRIYRCIIWPSNHHPFWPNAIFDTLGVSDLIELGFSRSRLLHLYRLLSHTQMRSLGFQVNGEHVAKKCHQTLAYFCCEGLFLLGFGLAFGSRAGSLAW